MGHVAGTASAQRQLNGPQTTRRTYRNLHEPAHTARCDKHVAVAMRDGVTLLADVHRPEGDGRFPALIAASPYPRQIQDLGAPMGFIEAGATDFWVPRGYAHVIANLRGTGGSGGTFGFFDEQERFHICAIGIRRGTIARPRSDKLARAFFLAARQFTERECDAICIRIGVIVLRVQHQPEIR